MRRRTVGGSARIEGRGLFTGADVVLTIRPGDAGLEFVSGGEHIRASIESLSSAAVVPAFAEMPARHTVLASGGSRVITTEHALAALVGMGITDAQLVLEGGEEIPIGDGSAEAFVRAIAEAGVREIDGPELDPLVVREVITVEDGRGGMIVAEPAAVPDFSYLLDYSRGGGDAAPLEKQTARWSGEAGAFERAVAPARTFSFQAEVEQMRGLGLFEGFTPRDLLVLDESGAPIENELRFDDEPARHKLLDLIGDLALVGRPIVGRVSAYRSGHALNHEMARRLVGEGSR